ncbi:MAG: hypothetical protein PW734_06185 [Verrucomicrobium sp.]|nr:hypothetical protein [Verrucomicrobium sp.]
MKRPTHLRARLFDLAYASRPLWKSSSWFLHELRYEGYETTSLEVESELAYLLGKGHLEMSFNLSNQKSFRLTASGIDAHERGQS